MKRRLGKSGFTLPEVLMAVVISVIVFAAMGSLLTRCFSLWLDAMAHWKLAQHARVTRTRILSGGFGVGSGLISSSNVTVSAYNEWDRITFSPIAVSGTRDVYGIRGEATPRNIWLKSSADSPDWAIGQSVGYYQMSDNPLVTVNEFDATLDGQQITITYTLNFGAMGKNFEQPHTIDAYLINVE